LNKIKLGILVFTKHHLNELNITSTWSFWEVAKKFSK